MSVLDPTIDHLDLATKHIYLLTDCREYHPVDDIYREIRNLRRTNESLRVFDIPVKAFGAVPKGGGKFTPRYVVFYDGWTIVPEDISHSLYISGEQLTSGGESGPACLDLTVLSSGVNLIVHYEPPSAELIKAEAELAAIARMEYGEAVTLDVIDGRSGTDNRTGTPSFPSNNGIDALTILDNYSFDTINVIGDYAFGTGEDISGLTIKGQSVLSSILEVTDPAMSVAVSFLNCHLLGILDGSCFVIECVITDLDFVAGYIMRCALGEGVIKIADGANAILMTTYSAYPGVRPTIDGGGVGVDNTVGIRGHTGGIILRNKNGPSRWTLDITSGDVIIDFETVTAGTIKVSGIGLLLDEATGNEIPSGVYGDLTIINQSVSKAEVAIAVWDEILTGVNHNLAGSAGRRLRTMSSIIVLEGNVVSSTLNTIKLNAEAADYDGAYDPALISITEGTGAGQSRLILQYTGANRTAVIDRNWKVFPDDTSVYTISAHPGREHVNEGLARGGGVDTIILNELASDQDDVYIGQTIFLRSGLGEDQACKILGYVGATRTLTACKPWAVIPNITTGYVILPTSYLDVDKFINSLWEHASATFILKIIKNKREIVKNIDVWELIVYDDDNMTSILTKELKDKDGNNITDFVAGIMTQELASSV